MKKVPIYFVLASLTLSCCVSEVKPNLPRYYVLCDFSTSQGIQSRQTIVQHAKRAFAKILDQQAKADYFDISAPQLEKPFYSYRPFTQEFMTPKEEDSMRHVKAAQKDSLNNIITAFYQQPLSNSTCIVQTIDKVANCLARDIDNSNQPIRIIIFSDLLEDCMSNQGRINIDGGHFDSAFERLSRMPQPIASFSAYKNLEISLVAASQRHINLNDLNRFWREIFKKYGYTLTEPISVSLPKWLTEE